ncbi:MAG: rRNA cytosine-C5-methyltransferase [Bacteroidaceae bacterium]|nr:rRNA cytosine-C5-methyltransferase [Bacteroidaceae bacterium]
MRLPNDFEQAMTNILGKDEYARLAEALSMPAPTSIRINPQKIEAEELAILKEAEQVPWCKDGFYLKERPSFTFDPLFHAGCYYVQEASSMFLAHVLKQYVNEPVVALDLCAAPGGKSTLALSELPEGSLLIANEVVRQRANILAENLTKWGNPNCIVTNNYAEDFQAFSHTFDLIICDAPCSGEGMFRKDPASIGEWSLANVETCWRRQRDIVSNIWHTLKEGGILIYSTCTYNPKEDEENVAWMVETLGAEVLSCKPLPNWGLTETNTHFYPHRTKGEGFFISVLRKTSTDEAPVVGHRKKNLPAQLLQQARRTLKVIYAGMEAPLQTDKHGRPNHSLALSNNLDRTAYPMVEVDESQAIAYLRTEALQLSPDTPRGYVLLTYKGHPLGFVKNIGSRANNLYPAEWRIRKQ